VTPAAPGDEAAPRSFAAPWGIGATLRLSPASDGRHAPDAYGTALAVLLVLQAAAVAWLLPMRNRDSAQPARR
jgi:hypothetical protein